MLHVVGGSYLEECLEPEWFQLFGSGLRAAAVARTWSGRVKLHTYINEGQRPNLQCQASTFKFSTNITVRSDSIGFFYRHGLSRPSVLPERNAIRVASDIQLKTSNILRFGMLEGQAVVHGDRVVYDPQSPDTPEPFHKNGSTASRLAIIANYREAASLAGASRIETIGRLLLRRHSAEVVIVKQGALGAAVFTRTRMSRVPAFKTDRVWPIGSGDTYAACFAALWADKKMAAYKAALQASLAAAYFCNFKTLPLPKNALQEAKRLFKPLASSKSHRRPPMVYLAGPFFTMAQRWLIDEARSCLAGQGVRVFSPFHAIGPGNADAVVPADIAAIRRSSALFAIADGTDPGTIFEIGFARALGIPVVIFVQSEPEEPLKMMAGTGTIICDDFATAIYRTSWEAQQ